jgi:F0F1-type ATP synthase epsilon subunit
VVAVSLGALPLEPDRGGRVLQDSAEHAEPEDQAAERGDKEARAGLERRASHHDQVRLVNACP